MTWLYLISGGIAAALFVYLSIALLKPEWFS
ncbi:MAG: potassium-transporting ATPase subunit F [Gammaproteobacteria bacterium]